MNYRSLDELKATCDELVERFAGITAQICKDEFAARPHKMGQTLSVRVLGVEVSFSKALKCR